MTDPSVGQKPKPKWTPELVKKLAVVLTGHQGSESLGRLAKQLVIGSAASKGFRDKQNDNLPEVYERPYVILGYFNALTRFSIESDAGRFKWDFAGGISDGQKLSGYASAKGRHSQWVGDGAEKVWKENNVTSVVLVGLADGDIRFFFIDKVEFLGLGHDRLSYKTDDPTLSRWETAWKELTFQQTFEGIFGGSNT